MSTRNHSVPLAESQQHVIHIALTMSAPCADDGPGRREFRASIPACHAHSVLGIARSRVANHGLDQPKVPISAAASETDLDASTPPQWQPAATQRCALTALPMMQRHCAHGALDMVRVDRCKFGFSDGHDVRNTSRIAPTTTSSAGRIGEGGADR